MRFLFTTLQFDESEFYGRVGAELARHGHEVAHVAFSRRAAGGLERRGARSYCLPDLMPGIGDGLDLAAETARIERRYEIPSLRDVYRTDPPCERRSEDWCVERTVRHFVALERVFDEVEPEVLVPEVGGETIRTAAHLIAIDRDVTTFFLFHTIFPRPLRLYENTMHAGIVPHGALRDLLPEERAEVEQFIAEFTGRGLPIRSYRRARITPSKLRDFVRHVAVRTLYERDNDYLSPRRYTTNLVEERVRAAASRRLYEPLGARPFVYFPLHVTDDYKIKRVIPHCADQASLIEQLAEALPQGHDLVLKEHPLAIGRTRVSLLRRLVRRDNIRLVDARTSSHELIRTASAVAVISSTVGLEALLYAKPVLTLGEPFYSGYGITLDVRSFAEIREKLPAVLRFRPDRELILRFMHAAMRSCYTGAPVGVDASDANAVALAASLASAATGRTPEAGRAKLGEPLHAGLTG